jgi:hypothetical protein
VELQEALNELTALGNVTWLPAERPPRQGYRQPKPVTVIPNRWAPPSRAAAIAAVFFTLPLLRPD